MKKYTLVLFVFALFIILLGFNIKSVSALVEGCSSISGFSTTTGASCEEDIQGVPGDALPPMCQHGFSTITGRALPCGCSLESGFSTTTGESCGGNTNLSTHSSSASPSCTIHRVLRIGSTGADVSCLQLRLGLISDGKFGPRTLIVVKAFQANAGLTSDGVVGPRSIVALEVAN